jgi:hypothetical protein
MSTAGLSETDSSAIDNPDWTNYAMRNISERRKKIFMVLMNEVPVFRTTTGLARLMYDYNLATRRALYRHLFEKCREKSTINTAWVEFMIDKSIWLVGFPDQDKNPFPFSPEGPPPMHPETDSEKDRFYADMCRDARYDGIPFGHIWKPWENGLAKVMPDAVDIEVEKRANHKALVEREARERAAAWEAATPEAIAENKAAKKKLDESFARVEDLHVRLGSIIGTTNRVQAGALAHEKDNARLKKKEQIMERLMAKLKTDLKEKEEDNAALKVQLSNLRLDREVYQAPSEEGK